MIWGDNEPYFLHANLILPQISLGKASNGNDIKIKVAGNYMGQ